MRKQIRASAVLAIATSWAAVVPAQENCAAPGEPVQLIDVRQFIPRSLKTPRPKVAPEALLVVDDPNPEEQVTGYNIYRSEDPSLPRDSWPLVAFDATPQTFGGDRVLGVPSTTNPGPGPSYYYVSALNSDCGALGPRGTSNQGDLDGDGVGFIEDRCPSTPTGAEQLRLGCAASDYILAPELITETIRGRALDLVEGSTGDTPPAFVAYVDTAAQEIGDAATRLREAKPCEAMTTLGNAADSLDEARTVLVELLSTLPGGLAPILGKSHSHQAHGAGTDGPVEWPSEEVLFLQSQLRSTLVLIDETAEAQMVASQVCSAQGDTRSFQGIVYEVSDDGRQVTLTSGERIIVPWTVTGEGGVALGKDTVIHTETRAYGLVYVADDYQIQPPAINIVPGPVAQDCVRMRVLPVQPTPAGNSNSGWIRHRFEGYEGSGDRLELEAGMRLMAEEFNCPGIVSGGGPNGENLKFNHYYRIAISYQPKTGSYISNQILAHTLRGNNHVGLPPTDSSQDTVIEVTRLKRSCLDSGVSIPIMDHLGNTVATEPIWNCSDEEVIDHQTLTARIRDPQAYCSATYSEDVFEIEDREVEQWESTHVVNVNAQADAPTPLTFSAVGDKIIDGSPVHGSPIGALEPFAVYGRNGHHHWGHATDNASGLDWPHATGVRNGQPFRYTCSVPALVRDRIDECISAPDTYYRLPYPGGTLVTVTQGIGGSFSHNGWQQFALDFDGNNGNELRAARGGTVIRLRTTMTMNCITDTCTNWGFPLLDEYGNHIAIRHEDGTVGWYAHMVHQSATVYLNQRINRGQFIGQMGNTGNSTGEHLHFHVTPVDEASWGNTTVPARYEAIDSDGADTQTCFIPTQGSSHISTQP